ncbi:MAG: excinuclease ABC subunit UvrC [Candidatus Hodarchaeales archaeon]
MNDSEKIEKPVELIKLPERPGVYKFKSAKGKIIYIGAASNLKKRVSSYFVKNHSDEKTKRLVKKISDLDYEILDSIEDVFLRERELISKHKPRFNIKWRDDKQYPYLKITLAEKWPRIIVVRNKTDDGSFYYGRKINTGAMRTAIKQLRKAFPACVSNSPVKPRSRPCLDANIGLCPAPCAGMITEKEYRKNINDLIKFLSGREENLINEWEEEMVILSENLEFERAAKMRDRIKAVRQTISFTRDKVERDFDVISATSVEKTTCILLYLIKNDRIANKQHVLLENIKLHEPTDVLQRYLKNNYLDFSFIPPKVIIPFEIDDLEMIQTWLSKKRKKEVELGVGDPENNKWLRLGMKEVRLIVTRHRMKRNKNKQKMIKGLNELKKTMGLLDPPRRLEAFDISSFRGSNPVGSLVVFKDGFPEKSSYRRFSIKGDFEDNDDVGMMAEVTHRHYKRLVDEKSELPDVIIVDGGKAQLNKVRAVLASLNLDLPIGALAKKKEELYLPEKTRPIPLKGTVRHLLQNLRDESHRFAIGYHRKKRMSGKLVSELDKIPGIGKKRKNALLSEFGSITRIMESPVEELEKIIPKKVAEEVFIYFQGKNSSPRD